MIFSLSKDFCEGCREADLADVLVNVQKNHHFIKADDETRDFINSVIKKHGSSNDKMHWSAFRDRNGYRPNTLLKQHLTPISFDAGADFNYFSYLASEPGHVFLENGNNEWPTYLGIVRVYKNDPHFKHIFEYLLDRMEKGQITGEHCGGRDQIIPTFESKEPHEPRKSWLLNRKSMFVFDRDTDSDAEFNGKNDKLFQFCCGKDYKSVSDTDIYSLDQPLMTWHSWYRRTIENYFDIRCYEDCEVNMQNVPSDPAKFHYFKIEERTEDDGTGVRVKFCLKYRKSNLHQLAKKIDRERLEKDLKIFDTKFGRVSELQLFMLKLVKLV